MRAIVTRFVSPTNHRPARVSATVGDKRIILPWDHSMGTDANHARVALSLARSLQWEGEWIPGSLPGAGMVFVCNDYKTIQTYWL